MIENFLKEEQDPKTVEKILQRLADLLAGDEELLYIAVQKKPLVNLLTDCVALTNKRILFFSPANLGLSIKCEDFVWKDIVNVFSNEEIIGAVFTVKTISGLELGVDYLPKIQARKLYQYAQERVQAEREARRLRDLEEKRAESGAMLFENTPKQTNQSPIPSEQPQPIVSEDHSKTGDLTEKLKKLKMLFDNELITLEDYNKKKQELLREL